MAKAPAISMSDSWMGISPVDGKTPFSFLVGTVAGLGGLNPSWAAVAVIGFEAALVALDEGVGSTFKPRSPQSYSNQVVDTLVGIAGVYYGEWLRNRKPPQQLVAASAEAQTSQNMQPTPDQSVAGPWYR